jgi:sucrose-6-phosphate hydrolase SacC (GH32 family)
MSFTPVKELETLRDGTKKLGPIELKPGDDPLAATKGELLDIELQFEPGQASEVELNVHGAAIRYQAGVWDIHGHKVPALERDGKQKLRLLVDRNSMEAFASDGLAYVPFPFIAKDGDQSVKISAKGGVAKIDSIVVNTLKSPWMQGGAVKP